LWAHVGGDTISPEWPNYRPGPEGELPPGFEPGFELGFAAPGFDPGFGVPGSVEPGVVDPGFDPPFGEFGFVFPGVPFGLVLGFGLSGLLGVVAPGLLGDPGSLAPGLFPVGGAVVLPVGG
jgi:hypothetical protein